MDLSVSEVSSSHAEEIEVEKDRKFFFSLVGSVNSVGSISGRILCVSGLGLGLGGLGGGEGEGVGGEELMLSMASFNVSFFSESRRMENVLNGERCLGARIPRWRNNLALEARSVCIECFQISARIEEEFKCGNLI